MGQGIGNAGNTLGQNLGIICTPIENSQTMIARILNTTTGNNAHAREDVRAVVVFPGLIEDPKRTVGSRHTTAACERFAGFFGSGC